MMDQRAFHRHTATSSEKSGEPSSRAFQEVSMHELGLLLCRDLELTSQWQTCNLNDRQTWPVFRMPVNQKSK